VSVTASTLEEFGPKIKSWTLIPSDGGRFEVTVNGDLVYSKLETGRHTDPEEIRQLLDEKLSLLENT
jgi:selenoprotein W-related protein